MIDVLRDAYHWYTADVADPNEIRVVTAALVVAAIFYAFAVVVFLWARKSRLNVALAAQKALWLVIIALVTLPTYWYYATLDGDALRALLEAAADRPGRPLLPVRVRMTIWALLPLTTLWVMVEVWRANRRERIASRDRGSG